MMAEAGLREKDGLSIRRMRKEDLPQVMEIERASFPTPWSERAFEIELRNRSAFYIVAEFEGRILGYAGMWLAGGEGHITTIAVHPDYRRLGLGELIMVALIERCIAEGFKDMVLEVRENNFAAQRLYLKYGFVDMGRRRGYYMDTGEDAIIMYLGLLDRPEYREFVKRRWEELWDVVPARVRDRNLVR